MKIFFSKLKRFISPKHIPLTLFAIAGVLMLIAAAIYIVQWNEGNRANQSAQALLAMSGFNSPTGDVQTEPAVETTQEMKALLRTEGADGCSVISRLDIPKLDLSLPVLSETTEKALKISVCYYLGAGAGENGNLVITGHNYRSGAHFGRLNKLEKGDVVSVTNQDGNKYDYTVYATESIRPNEPEALEKTSYNRELTLMTCESNGNRRLLVRCVCNS